LIDLDEDVASFHDLVVDDGDPRHGPADARRHLGDMAVHLRVVGRLTAAGDE
jgi:hypothetical protein